jgi:F-type H+-transporting ATPase subunit b
MLQTITTFSDSSSGLGALGINFSSFIIQLITFVIVFWVLKRYAFKPIAKILAERRKLIDEGVSLGEQMKKKQAELEEEITRELHKARLDADKVISTSQDEARQIIQKAEDDARAKAELISQEAKERIEQDIALARKKLERELAGLVADATEAIIDEKIDPKKDAKLIEKALTQRRAA